MILILCIDNKNGLMFNGRRQSKDRVLRKRIREFVGKRRFLLRPYSAEQFEKLPENTIILDNIWGTAGDEDVCFAEEQIPEEHLSAISTLVIYRWNREYPADVCFPLKELIGRLRLVKQTDFSGNSHNRITEEIYESA